MTDIRQTAEWGQFLGSLGWKAEKAGHDFIFVRTLPLIGSILKIPRAPQNLDFNAIDRIAHKHRALFVKLDPSVLLGDTPFEKELQEHGFRAENWSLAPTKTFILSISSSQDELLRSFEKDTRYSINASTKRGVTVLQSEEIETFYGLYKQTAKRGGFWIGSETEVTALYKAFSGSHKADLLLSYSQEHQLVAGCLVLYEGTTAYYHMAASSAAHRELMAPYSTVWEAIKLAKRRGYDFFDFEGIVDPRFRETKRWAGFTHFKRGFRGEEVTYLGSYVKYYNPFMKLFNQLFGKW